jgi:hypothetical protein
MRIGFLSSDWADYITSAPGGCCWIRAVSIAEALNKIDGYEAFCGEYGWSEEEGFVIVPTIERVKFGSHAPIENFDHYVGNLDVVILKLWMWHEYEYYIKRAQELGQVVIIDIDDNFSNLPQYNIAFHTTDPKKNEKWNRDHMLKSYKFVDGLIASTEFLHDYYKKDNPEMYLVKNAVDPNRFLKRMDFAGNKPKIGWVGIMLWRKDDIEMLQGWLGQFLEKHDLKFHHSGMLMDKPKDLAHIAKFDPERLEEITGTNVWNYSNILLPIDIGIVPLTANSFNEAKSSLKGVEYAMSGIPFVSGNTHEYRVMAEEGIGRIAKKPYDWMKHLEALIDPETRRNEAEKNYNLALEKYNLSHRVYEWIEVINKIYEKSMQDGRVRS